MYDDIDCDVTDSVNYNDDEIGAMATAYLGHFHTTGQLYRRCDCLSERWPTRKTSMSGVHGFEILMTIG